MNVLHLDEQRGWRGGEQQASYLIRGLAERGHRNWIAGRAGTPFLERDHGDANLTRIALPFRGEWDVYTAWRIASESKRNAVDVVHAHTSHAHTIACIAKKLNPRVRVVVSRRVDFPPRTGWTNRKKYRAPDAYIAISNRIAEILREYDPGGPPVHIVHSAIDPGRMAAAPIAKRELGLDDDVEIVGNVAALVDHKDQKTLVKAMKKVVETWPKCVLVVAGEGELRSELEILIRELGLNSNIKLLGYRDDVPNLLNTFNVFVMSSKLEGLGTSVLDAMAAGVPVVATDAGGLPEMVTDGETGLLVPAQDPEALANAILEALANPQAAQDRASRAKQLLQNRFTVDRMVEGNLAVYESLTRSTER